MPKIAILDDYLESAMKFGDWKSLPEEYEISIFKNTLVDPRDLIKRLIDFEIICAMRERTPFPKHIFDKLPNLKLFITTGMRNASVDISAAKENGITVCGTEGSKWATAEHTWALIQSCARNIPHDDFMMKKNYWQTRMGVELHGRTLGILGLGRIGEQVSRFGKAFGMDVTAWSQNLSKERCNELDVKLVDKESLFKNSDFLTIHLVLSERTKHIVAEPEFKLMKPNAFLINTSRGPIVKESALITALATRSIRSAAVDVFEEEPLPPNHRFCELDNLVMTPHTGYMTEETYKIFFGQTIENIKAWHTGKPKRALTT